MQEIILNSVRFIKLYLRNYGVFLGSNEIDFDRHCTLIIGNSGTGKTTIVNALANLGPAIGVKPHSQAKSPEMSVEVLTEGNRNLVKKYSRLIFLDEESIYSHMFNNEDPFIDILDHQQLKAVKDEARENFQTMLSRKTWKIETHKDLNPNIMAAGERICFGYAYIFAVRKILNLDLPAVFDAPFGRLDRQLKQEVRAFLKDQPCQQIMLFLGGYEFDEHDKLDYTLDYRDGYTIVIKSG
jgi:ABC-type glutathione transport system ATPase component